MRTEMLPSVLTSWFGNFLWYHETHHYHSHSTQPKMKHYPLLLTEVSLQKQSTLQWYFYISLNIQNIPGTLTSLTFSCVAVLGLYKLLMIMDFNRVKAKLPSCRSNPPLKWRVENAKYCQVSSKFNIEYLA